MRRIHAFVFLSLWTPLAGAEVVVERFHGPPVEPKADTAARAAVAKGNRPSDQNWFIPLFKVDATASAFGSSTFFSIRNEGDVVTNVLVEYFGQVFAPPRQQSQRYVLAPNGLVSVNVRDVEDLAVDGDGFARGLIRITPRQDEPVSVDVFQVDAENDFAVGGAAFLLPDDFCTNWQVRFLSFGGLSGGSVMTVMVNGPRGTGANAPATVSGTVYNQQGTPINNFTIRTDQWAFEVELLELVEDDETAFGSIELVVNATAFPRGAVSVAHSAHGRFSVGAEGVCKDGL